MDLYGKYILAGLQKNEAQNFNFCSLKVHLMKTQVFFILKAC